MPALRQVTPGARVPSEFVGLARDLIRRIAASHRAADARRSALLAPFRPAESIRIFMPTPRPGAMTRLASRLRTAAPLCRLRLTVEHEGDGLTVAEAWLMPAAVENDNWAGEEPALALLQRRLEIGPLRFVDEHRYVAGVGLHGLARRYERCADRSDTAVLGDLAALAEGYAAAAASGGEFEIPVPSGGRWIGAVGPGDAVAIVRTYMGD